MKATFTPPSLELVHEIGCSMGLPMRECEKFYAYFESVGWVVGRSRKPAKSLRGLIATWKLNLEERREISARISPSVEAINNRANLERVEARIKELKGQMPFTPRDGNLEKLQTLKSKRHDLLTKLNFSA